MASAGQKKTLLNPQSGAAMGSAREPLFVSSSGMASGRAVFDDIALGNGKYVAVLFNTNTSYDVVVERIYVRHANLTAATGVIAELTLRRISAFTTGTAVTPIMDDPETDSVPSGVSADHNSSAVSDVSGGLVQRFHRTGEELILAADTLLLSGSHNGGALVYDRKDGMRGITLSGTTAANRGLAVKCETNTTEGTVNIEIEFSIRPT